MPKHTVGEWLTEPGKATGLHPDAICEISDSLTKG